jgi:hypothetical protein
MIWDSVLLSSPGRETSGVGITTLVQDAKRRMDKRRSIILMGSFVWFIMGILSWDRV